MVPAAAAISSKATNSTSPTEPLRGALWLLSKACRPSTEACLSPPGGCAAGSWLAMSPECLNRGYWRKSQPAAIPCLMSCFLRRPGNRPAQPHDIADHFGHRLVVLDGDGLIHLDGGV